MVLFSGCAQILFASILLRSINFFIVHIAAKFCICLYFMHFVTYYVVYALLPLNFYVIAIKILNIYAVFATDIFFHFM